LGLIKLRMTEGLCNGSTSKKYVMLAQSAAMSFRWLEAQKNVISDGVKYRLGGLEVEYYRATAGLQVHEGLEPA